MKENYSTKVKDSQSKTVQEQLLEKQGSIKQAREIPRVFEALDYSNNLTVREAIIEDPFLGYESFADAVNDCFYTSQLEALCRMINGDNIFLSGPAGAGKSSIVEPFINFVKESNSSEPNADGKLPYPVNVTATATTGIAATNINGITIHSAAGLMQDNFSFSMELFKADILIVDEISMLPAHQFEKLDKHLRFVKKEPYKPFGGVQLILMGDFQQLPPIRDFLKPWLNCGYAIESEAWHKADIKHLYLDKLRRSGSDKGFAELLGRISSGKMTKQDLMTLNKRMRTEEELEKIKATRSLIYMYPTNREIDKVNNEKLKELHGYVYDYQPSIRVIEGSYDPSNPEDVLTSQRREQNLEKIGTVQLKVGAQVYLTKNRKIIDYEKARKICEKKGISSISALPDPPRMLLPSGAMGTVVDLDDKSATVHFSKINKTILIEMEKEAITSSRPTMAETEVTELDKQGRTVIRKEYRKVMKPIAIAIASYMPLRLGWAISIHKSQGQTYDGEIVDLSKTFSAGLGYVAVSRVRSLEDLYFSAPVKESFFKMNEKSVSITSWVKKQALKNRKEFIENSDYYESMMSYFGLNVAYNPADRKAMVNKDYKPDEVRKIIGLPLGE